MIKLPETLQEVFDIVSKHLLTQNKRSESLYGSCKYRDPRGLMCAAGVLIPDDQYDSKFEDQVWRTLVDKKFVEPKFVEEICELQVIHDEEYCEWWIKHLVLFAKKYSLKVNFEV